MMQPRLTLNKLAVCVLILASAVMLVGASTGGEQESPPSPDPFQSKVLWTTDGKHIIFSRGYQGIFMVDRAGSKLRAIPEGAPMGTLSSPGYALPALSPDGTRLAFVVRPSGLAQSAAIMVSSLDGTGSRRLSRDEKFNTHPAWSPDGTEIAYIADGKLTVMRADGTDVRVLVPSVEALNAAVAWSPDGSRIAFVGTKQDAAHSKSVYTVQPDGTGLTELGPTVSVPSWSPDGSRIGFLVPEGEGEISLYTASSVGVDLQRVWSLSQANVRQAWSLVQTGRWYGNLSWSPDGSAILHVSNAGEIAVVSLDYGIEKLRFGFGSTVDSGRFPVLSKALPRGTLARASGRWAAWTPDGYRVAVLSNLYQDSRSNSKQLRELYTMERDGILERVLVHRQDTRLVAEHLGWYDTARNIAACAEGFVVPEPENSPGLVQDCKILMAIRDELSGEFFLNWSPAVPITHWLGVAVLPFGSVREEQTYRVEGLYLRGRGGIDGMDNYSARLLGLPYAYYSIHGLTTIRGWAEEHDIGLNGLSGRIPPELGRLTRLQALELSHNSLSGGIPPELGNAANLIHIDLGHNDLSGSIPPELSKLSDLQSLDLSHNTLSGEIPAELGNLRFLGLLELNHNVLTGNIPVELGNLRVQVFDLSHNELSGCIPSQLADVVYAPEGNAIFRLNGNHLMECSQSK